MRRLVALLLLSACPTVAPLTAFAQSFDSQIQANLGTQFGAGGGNTTEEQFIGNTTTAEGTGRDMTRDSAIPSNLQISGRETYLPGDQTRLAPQVPR